MCNLKLNRTGNYTQMWAKFFKSFYSCTFECLQHLRTDKLPHQKQHKTDNQNVNKGNLYL